ncbi:Sec7 domain-containing protein [Nannizzia gypsea CBS 118893]|uniref:Sec7 domain-containing protein n=1 Tax=Arthroderma gypseum (strain ATCC MYA-4604 / CBS 118893) TaxID=535722 RepID=E4UX74_ARTGP|nr:Sec7 domain-containing protein [Nannizzia gypsea CBS 118893]EFR02661.1 Sec7 domain-containing protein [Nannizzia gypsea CBS 118893]
MPSSYRNPLSRASRHPDHRPQTPPQYRKETVSTRSRQLVRPSFPETFLDDFNPIDRHNNNHGDVQDVDSVDEDERDPHDLSLNPALGVRSSVVDNMLLSLDQFSPSDAADCSFDDSLPYDSPHQQQESFSAYSSYHHHSDNNSNNHNNFSSSANSRIFSNRNNNSYNNDNSNGNDTSDNTRFRSHTLSSSVSSDVEPYTHKGSHGQRHRHQNRHEADGRGYRSNSNPKKQPTIRHVDGSSEGERTTYRSKVYDSQRAISSNDRSQSRTTPRFVRRESTGSASSSIDLNEMLATTSIYGTRRSASFDYGSTLPSRANGRDPSFGHRDTMMQYDDMNAAPTPTVLLGPRKEFAPPALSDHASTVHASTPPETSRTPSLAHKNSTRSARSMYSRKNKSDTLGTSTIRGRNDEYNKYFGESQDLIPPVPALNQSSAPSPTIARSKQPLPATFPVENVSTPPSKERQGFFRRVFGSSKQSSPSQSDVSPHSARDNETDPSRYDNVSIHPRPYRPPPVPRDPSTANNATRENPPVVTKKPSSFFRRRKKSVVENVPPPLLPLSNLSSTEVPKPESLETEKLRISPATDSLRTDSLSRAMKPYLSDMDSPKHSPTHSSKPSSRGGKSRDQQETDESDIESPVKREKLRVKAPEIKSSKKLQKLGYLSNPNSSRRAAGASKTSPKSNSHSRATNFDGSFLADSSGNEGLSTKHSGNKNKQSRRPQTSPDPPSQQYEHSTPRPKGELVLSDRVNGGKSQSGDSNSNSLLEPTISPAHSKQASAPASPNSTQSEHTSRQKQAGLHIDTSGKPLFATDKDKSPRISTSTSITSNYHTAQSTPVPSSDENLAWGSTAMAPSQGNLDTTDGGLHENTPCPEDRQQAQKIFDNNDEELAAGRYTAAWLGTPDRGMLRKAYMDLFDWSDMNILSSLRSLCTKIALKGEAQQVDRVLDAFSCRWCECNPNHGFKATDVVHTISYSLLLLNTDLHLADIEQKMTKPQFIKNTMPTIQRVVTEAAPEAFGTSQSSRPQTKQTAESEGSHPKNSPVPYLDKQFSHSPTTIERSDEPPTIDIPIIEHPSMPPPRLSSRASFLDTGHGLQSLAGPLVSTPFNGTMKAWEAQVEMVLKDYYTSIHKQKLPLRGVTTESDEHIPAHGGFLTLTHNMLRRTPSTISRAGAGDTYRGRGAENRLNAARWSSKARSRPRLYPPSAMGSSRTSLDDQSFVWSPSGSSTWSKNSLGKTLTSMSVDSLGSEYPRGDYQQSIGFANALSHAIIREDSAHSIAPSEDPARVAMVLEDEGLELAGAPWAKEGSLKHKHHLDSIDKRAKDRNWNETFAVIQRGWMRLFSFNSNNKSSRLKPKQRQNGGLVVGGGNWMENADETWKFLLRHTIASALPAPGYSKSRPHVWALSLPTGAVHLFQVEFVSTANYWSARLSKGPLFGAVSNIEYGWSDAVINNAVSSLDDSNLPNSAPSSSSSAPLPRPSLQSSIRSSIDQGVRPRLPADRIVLSDWRPPQQSMMASTSSEAEQLETLRSYVKHVEQELQRHNELRPALMLAFTPKHANYSKALHNWERKSSYLLREIVKFRTYIDSLVWAETQRERIYQADAAKEEESNTGNPAPVET